MVQQINDFDKFNDVLTHQDNKDKLIVVDFFASWCKPCKAIAPAFAELYTVFENALFIKVENIDDETDEIFDAHNVSSFPTFLFFRNGKELDRYSGSKLSILVNKIKEHYKDAQQII